MCETEDTLKKKKNSGWHQLLKLKIVLGESPVFDQCPPHTGLQEIQEESSSAPGVTFSSAGVLYLQPANDGNIETTDQHIHPLHISAFYRPADPDVMFLSLQMFLYCIADFNGREPFR